MDTDQFIKYLAGIIDLSTGFIQEVNTCLTEEFYVFRQIIQGKGQTESRFWYLKTGLARSYIIDDERQQHTLRFWKPGEIIFSYAGFLKQPSHEYIDLLEESELYSFTYEKLHQLMNQYPETAIIAGTINRHYQLSEHKKNYLHFLNTEERYREFRKENPALFQKVSLNIIASYLHMTRENLSRVISKESH